MTRPFPASFAGNAGEDQGGAGGREEAHPLRRLVRPRHRSAEQVPLPDVQAEHLSDEPVGEGLYPQEEQVAAQDQGVDRQERPGSPVDSVLRPV